MHVLVVMGICDDFDPQSRGRAFSDVGAFLVVLDVHESTGLHVLVDIEVVLAKHDLNLVVLGDRQVSVRVHAMQNSAHAPFESWGPHHQWPLFYR